MAIKFTEEQQQVIDLRECNILVSAAAGSGKTAVLVERIIQMVCDAQHPVDVDRLLVVTFTKAAAAEMRERVALGLSRRLAEQPENEHIQKQVSLLHNAQICTIDSFCSFLVKNHFNEIGVDPAFRLMDEGEKKLLEQETMAELLEDAFASGDQEVRYCVEYFCYGSNESALEEYIKNLAEYASSHPWPKDWLREREADCREATVEEFEDGDCGKYLKRHIGLMLEGCVAKYQQIQKLCEQKDGPYMYWDTIEEEKKALEKIRQISGLRELAANLPAVVFKTLPGCKDDTVSLEKRELAKNWRQNIKDTIADINEKFFTKDVQAAINQGAACERAISALVGLTLQYVERLEQKKKEKKSFDFADIEHYALDILLKKDEDGVVQPTHIAREYREYYAEIMIDEYQDSNMIQEYLLKAVSGEEDGKFNRFIVGDVKQSIYKFRLSRPELFIEKYNSYEEEGQRRRIDLAKNFRSRSQVLSSVNEVFYRLMSRENGGVEYDEKAALYAGASFAEIDDATTELILVDKPTADSFYNEREAEATVIGNRIKRLYREFQVTDKHTGELRPLRYSDIVILLRAGSGWDEEFKRVLEEMGIPTHVTARKGYFSATEVQTVLQFLRVLDNPRQDIPLFGVMKSVFGGFTEEEIAMVRSGKKKQLLYQALVEYESRDALGEKVQEFLKKISEYRELAVYLPICDLLTKILQDVDYLNYVTALPGGGKRRANVEMLLTKASDFEKTSYFGLFHFVRYMEQLEKYDVDYGEADQLDENADVVRIITIHKSKGLEFPVVFMAGMSKRFNMMDTNKSMVIDSDLGVATNYVDAVKRIRSVTLQKKILIAKMREESIAEEMRLLYVAMTRAKEKLIMTGIVKDAIGTWASLEYNRQDKIYYADFCGASSYMSFVLPIVNECNIRVEAISADDLWIDKVSEQVSLETKRGWLTRADADADAEIYQRVSSQLETAYEAEYLRDLYTKTTVSELKIAAMSDRDEEAYHAFEEREEEVYVPKFRREKEEVTGTVRGNAYHRVMELMDLSLTDEARIHTFLEEQVREKRLTEEYKNAVRVKKILNFLRSPLGQRMKKAQEEGKLYKEQPFVLGIPANRLKETYPAQETVLIQGIIDVFWEEDGELVLLDYKTDSIHGMEDLWNRYGTQIDYYKEALEHIMDKPVKEAFLYSFHLETY